MEARFYPMGPRPAIGVIPELRPMEKAMPSADEFVQETLRFWEHEDENAITEAEAAAMAWRTGRFYAILLGLHLDLEEIENED
jgi:hypothetical protein